MATSAGKLAHKDCIKNRNCGDAKFFLICCRKKQRTNAKSERSKCRGLAICRCRKIYAMIGVELRPYG